MNRFKVGQKVRLNPICYNVPSTQYKGIDDSGMFQVSRFTGIENVIGIRELNINDQSSYIYQLSNGYWYSEENLLSDSRDSLLHLLQSYIGMTPSDVGCKSWNEMQEQLADKILSMNLGVKECPFDANNESGKPTFRNCEKWKENDHGCRDCNLFKG